MESTKGVAHGRNACSMQRMGSAWVAHGSGQHVRGQHKEMDRVMKRFPSLISVLLLEMRLRG